MLPKLTQDFLLSRLSYDAQTGELRWKSLPASEFSSPHAHKIFKAQYAGKIAGGPSWDGYWLVYLNRKKYRAHRIIWLMIYGVEPDIIDHINGDISDNRLSNLRSVDTAANGKNRPITRANRSGTQGVSWHPKVGKWRARISADRKARHLGFFNDFDAALKARKEAEAALGFHKNHGRPPRVAA